MQQCKIGRTITGKAKSFSTINQSKIASRFRKNKIIREYHYFRTREAAEKYITTESEKDPDSSYSKIWPDKATTKYALIKFRKY